MPILSTQPIGNPKSSIAKPDSSCILSKIPWTNNFIYHKKHALINELNNEIDILNNYIKLLNDTELSKNQVDPALFFLSANALFRIALQNEEVSTVVEKLDEAVQAYANLLKKEPEHQDAAYNYEFVIKFRNALAAQIKSQTLDRAAQEAERDLPPPPAVHGDEGAPPIDTEEEDFNVIIPLRPEERDELMKAGSGRQPKRRG